MRILGFSQRWPKLEENVFTTFRFTRRDRDWEVGELVQVVYQPRRKGGGEKLGIAEIVSKRRQLPWLGDVSVEEARQDGFKNYTEMWQWFYKIYGKRLIEPMNKLTLRWVK